MEDRWAPYMEWAKARPVPRWDLAGSNLLACTLEDLPGARDVLEIHGLNPDGYLPLNEAIARRHGVDVEQVAPGVGCSGANFLAMAALVRPGDEVLVERPAYDPLLGALRLLGASIGRFDRTWGDGWALDPDRVRAALSGRTRLIVLSSPHNPSGVLASTDALRDVGRLAELAGAHVLVDEVYLDAVYDNRPPPAATLSDVFLSTSSLTKAYGLSGLRIGWVLASPAVAQSVRRVRDVMEGISSFPSDRLGLLAFQHIDALEARARSIIQPGLAALAAFVAERPELDWVRPDGGTVAFPRLAGHRDTRAFTEQLLDRHGTAVVPGAFFEAPQHIRIAFGCESGALAGGLAAIREALDAETVLTTEDAPRAQA